MTIYPFDLARREEEILRNDAVSLIGDMMQLSQTSQAELGRRLGRQRSSVNMMLRGEGNFTLSTLARFAHAMGYRVILDVEPLDADEDQ